MGSGVNRSFWKEKGSRTSRRSGTKSLKQRGGNAARRIKAFRAEAARRSGS
jgi:hypothetical protein